MPLPESYGTPRSWDKNSFGDARNSDLAQYSSDVTEVARTLAAHGGGVASFDLALDLVLNEVVEQARLATGATGAAIALARAGEMVCRATTGGDAPDLGVRLETTSGLSGACLQTGTIQRCNDADSDPRVNSEASRSLGVRSILVLPLWNDKERFGVLEVFSSRPDAFGDRDINTLRVLARRVTENKNKSGVEQADEVLTFDHSSSSAIDSKVLPVDEQQQDSANAIDQASRQRNEVWGTILSACVIGVAVLLGLALGWRMGVRRGERQESQAHPIVSVNTDAIRVPGSAESPPPAPTDTLARGPTDGSAPPAKESSAAASVAPPTGGLQVTQNGRVIYRLPPPELVAAIGTSASVARPNEGQNTRLIHRVEPEYPPQARAQHIQGAVKLDVQIGGEGVIHNIKVVSGDPLLVEAAVQAVRQWMYRPYTVDGRPAEMQTRITIRFKLPPR
jgi:TonB family protein